MKIKTLFALAGLTLCLAAFSRVEAGAGLPDETLDALERFYHHFDGDNWHRNNGWLEPGSDPCDWYGVYCGGPGPFGLYSLSLPFNNLAGDWHESDISGFSSYGIALPGNRITGQLHEIPAWIEVFDLSENMLSGALPEIPELTLLPETRVQVKYLYLANNKFDGEVPESWRNFRLLHLDLAGNQLEGSTETAFRAVGRAESNAYLGLADNRFTGAVPEWVSNRNTFYLRKHNDQATAGGLNLCWNDLRIESEAVDLWVAQHHVGGGDYAACLNRDRVAIGAEMSGSWYDPARSGEGVVLQLLEHGEPLMFVFTFDAVGRQHWLYEVGTSRDKTLHWRRVLATRGRFGEGLHHGWPPPINGYNPAGFGFTWRLDRTGEAALHIERGYLDASGCNVAWPPCLGGVLSDRFDYVQLTRLAGTTCNNRQPHEWISGAWYDPERSGEGFVVEVIEDGRGVVYWFTHQPDDSLHQAWMMGVGEFDGTTLTIDNLIQPQGGRWGDDFDASEIDRVHWGSLTMEFADEETGHIYWDSVLEGFGAGDYPVQRLARARLAECD